MSNDRLLMELEMAGFVERHSVATMIELLIEVERRRLDLALAYTSMFDFCVRRLALTENEAFRRLACARLVVDFPSVLTPLREGKVTLTNLVLLRDFFTEANIGALLSEIDGKTKKQVEAIVARLRPRPDVPDSIHIAGAQAELVSSTSGLTAGPTRATESVRIIAEDRHVFTFTGSAELRDKLEKARGLMHLHPRGDSLAAVVEAALDLLIAERERVKLAKTTRPRTAKASKDPGYVPAATRREVAERDQMQCTFVSDEGVRCPARKRLELDHRQPRARGGAGDATNVRLLCSAHNRYEAEKAFGREHIERSIDMARAKRRAPAASAPAAEVPTPTATRAPEQDAGASATKHASLRYALVKDFGFDSKESDRLLGAMMADPVWWSRPLATLIVDAVGRLAKGAPAK